MFFYNTSFQSSTYDRVAIERKAYKVKIDEMLFRLKIIIRQHWDLHYKINCLTFAQKTKIIHC